MSKENSSNSDRIPSSIKSGVEKIFTHAILAATFVATSGLILQTDAPVLASQPCSGPPIVNGTGITFDFRDACERHDACYTVVRQAQTGGRFVRNNQYFKACDYLFLQDMRSHCEARWSLWDPRRAGCKTMAYSYFSAVLGVTIAGRS